MTRYAIDEARGELTAVWETGYGAVTARVAPCGGAEDGEEPGGPAEAVGATGSRAGGAVEAVVEPPQQMGGRRAGLHRRLLPAARHSAAQAPDARRQLASAVGRHVDGAAVVAEAEEVPALAGRPDPALLLVHDQAGSGQAFPEGALDGLHRGRRHQDDDVVGIAGVGRAQARGHVVELLQVQVRQERS